MCLKRLDPERLWYSEHPAPIFRPWKCIYPRESHRCSFNVVADLHRSVFISVQLWHDPGKLNQAHSELMPPAPFLKKLDQGAPRDSLSYLFLPKKCTLRIWEVFITYIFIDMNQRTLIKIIEIIFN